MLGLDTNVLLRFLLELDDADQNRRARDLVLNRCVPSSPGYVSAIVACELAWVLRSTYGFGPAAILDALTALLEAENIRVEDQEIAAEAVSLCRSRNVGFADAYIGLRNARHGCATTVTFDRRCLRLPQFSAPSN